MTTISSPSPSISPKPFGSGSSNTVVAPSRSAWGVATTRPSGGGTSPFSRTRPSPTIATAIHQHHKSSRDVVPPPRSARNSSSSASVVSPGASCSRSSPRINESQQSELNSSNTTRSTSLRQTTTTATSTKDFGTQYSPIGFPPTAGARLSELPTYEALLAASFRSGQHKASVPAKRETSEDVVMSDRPAVAEASSNSRGKSTTQPQAKDIAQPLPTFTPALHSGDISAQAAAARSMRTPKRPDSNASDSTSGSSALSLVNSLPSPSKKSRLNAPNMKVMPRNYMECDIRELGIIIADMLGELIRLNDKLPPRDGFLTRFHSRAPPTISVRDYLHRLIVHATLSPPLLLALVYYIDRLCALYPAFTITSLTVHRFLITAATVAAKGLSDSFWTNHTYARVGGVSTKELAMLELDFLSRLDWAIVPQPEVLEDYYRSLIARTEGYVLEEGGSSDES